jgi:hypothetical protein
MPVARIVAQENTCAQLAQSDTGADPKLATFVYAGMAGSSFGVSMRWLIVNSCLATLAACSARSTEPPAARPTRHDASAADSSVAAAVDASVIEQNSGDPAYVAPKPKTGDAALLAFARDCAVAAKRANLVIDSAKIHRFDGNIWVMFAEKRETPAGPYPLDVTDTKRGCVWIPRE